MRHGRRAGILSALAIAAALPLGCFGGGDTADRLARGRDEAAARTAKTDRSPGSQEPTGRPNGKGTRMDLGTLFWVFFIIITLQPVVKKRLLEAARAKLMAQLEKRRGSRVILLIHRQETMSFLGFPLMRYIDVDDAEEVLRAIQLTDPEVPIDLVLHTPGGLVLASLQIARAIAKHPGKVTVFVPHYAMSGGTLIALAADAIVMSRHAVLGPVDPQIGKYPAASILKVTRSKPIADTDDETLILADQAEKAINQVRQGVRELIDWMEPPEKADELAQLLSEGRWTHDYPITVEEAARLGLPVSTDMPQEVLDLMRLYPQPVRHQSTVEYIPLPRRSPGRSGK